MNILLKKIILIVCSLPIIIGFSACNPDEKSPIPLDKMSAILTDIHIAEYYSQGLGTDNQKYAKNYDSLSLFYVSILKHHNVNIEQFDATFKWLTHHPNVMDSVYNVVANNIQNLQTKASKQNTPSE